MVISEEVAKDGIKNILDVFLRDAESRNQYDVLISRDCTAQELLSILTPLETISSSNIKDSLKANSNHLGSTAMVKMEQMLNTYLNDKIEIAIPSITLQGDPNEGDKNENIEESNSTAKVILSNTAIFKKDKLVGYLTQEEDIAANFIKNNINNTLITYKCDDKNYATVEIIKSSAKITTDQNKLKLNIKIKGTGNLNEMNCQVNLEKEQTIHTIEKEVEKTLKQMLEKVIKKTRETYKSDIFGFEDIIYKNNNKLYNKVKDDWDNKYFYDLKIDIDTDIDIIEKGQILRVISNE